MSTRALYVLSELSWLWRHMHRTEGFIRRELQGRRINISFKTDWLLQILMEVFNFPPSLFSHRGLTLHPHRSGSAEGKLHTQPASVRRDSVATTQKNEKKWGGEGEKLQSFITSPCTSVTGVGESELKEEGSGMLKLQKQSGEFFGDLS